MVDCLNMNRVHFNRGWRLLSLRTSLRICIAVSLCHAQFAIVKCNTLAYYVQAAVMLLHQFAISSTYKNIVIDSSGWLVGWDSSKVKVCEQSNAENKCQVDKMK